MNVGMLRRTSATIVQRIMVARPAVATGSRAVSAIVAQHQEVHSYPPALAATAPFYNSSTVQHQLYSSSSSGIEATTTNNNNWDDAHQFGYRVVVSSPSSMNHDSTFSSEQGEGEEEYAILTGTATAAYDPCYIGSSFLPQHDDLYEQEEAEAEEVPRDTCSTRTSPPAPPLKLSLTATADVVAAHEEWDAMMLSPSTTFTESTRQPQQRKLSLATVAAEVLAAHVEWDALLVSEADKPPHFECLKEDPYLSDHEEMLPRHVLVTTHFEDYYDNWYFDFLDGDKRVATR
jgi:hypothetical protein